MDKAVLISHSSRDEDFIVKLRQAMEAHGLYNWVDSRDLRGGVDLTMKIRAEIEKSRAFIVVLSADAFNSAWVAEETRYASKIKENRQENYPMIALLREGIELGALKWIFSGEPIAIRVKNSPGGISEAMPQILAALGEKPSTDPKTGKSLPSEPSEELILELKFPYIMEKNGKHRAVARSELTYISAKHSDSPLKCLRAFLFTSPLGPIEINELRWYLERYYLWPTGMFKTRAENVEKKLPEWGQELYAEVMPKGICDNIVSVWKKISVQAERRFSIFVDSQLSKGSTREKQNEADEAAALLLGLPWELLHDGHDYLFHGARSVRAVPRSLEHHLEHHL